MEKCTQKPSRHQFAVADVKPATEGLPVTSARAILERSIRSRILTGSVGDKKVLKQGDFNPLIAAAFLAFKQHYPLVLSPDMIWLTILQGVAQHVQNNAESLRKRLVRHETKIELVVQTNLNSLPANDLEMLMVAGEFVTRISQHVPVDKQFLFQTQFSTTSDIDRIAASVALMDTFQPYFDYVLMCICGIPSVTLEGSPEDWSLLKSKVECLGATDLELSWWTKHLVPLCDQFVRAACGDIDRGHWQNLCKITASYGTEDLNGWLLEFIPYVRRSKSEPATLRNPVLELPDFEDPAPEDGASDKITSCTSDMLPSGLSRVPVKFMRPNSAGAETLEFVAGLVGVTQSSVDLSLRPLTGWAICEGAPMDRYIVKLRHEHEVLPPVGMDPWKMMKTFFGWSLPADVWRFYSETNGALLKFPDSRKTCRILPLAEVAPVWNQNQLRKELSGMQKRGEISINELQEHQEFNAAFGHLVRIAELGDGTFYVFGNRPKNWRSPLDSGAPNLSESGGYPKAVFLWTGERKAESFSLAADSFTDLLASLLGNSNLPPKISATKQKSDA